MNEYVVWYEIGDVYAGYKQRALFIEAYTMTEAKEKFITFKESQHKSIINIVVELRGEVKC